MDLLDVSLRLTPAAAAALTGMAQERDVTPGQVVRELLHQELRRTRNAKTPNRADEQLVARLQRLLAAEMASAVSWSDMRARLARCGYQVRPAGGGLTLHDAQGTRLCKSSELGFAYSRLVRKFRAPMPGHPHRMAHLMNENAAGSDPGDDDVELFEPF